MSSSEPPWPPDDWPGGEGSGGGFPDDTRGVPVGPEPEPTGAAGYGGGPGGWGEPPTTEPFAVAALVWAIVSLAIPVIGTVIALVLAGRAADSIGRSQGTRSGGQLVRASRMIAGGALAAWAIGLIVFFAVRGGPDHGTVAFPTHPSPVSTTAR